MKFNMYTKRKAAFFISITRGLLCCRTLLYVCHRQGSSRAKLFMIHYIALCGAFIKELLWQSALGHLLAVENVNWHCPLCTT